MNATPHPRAKDLSVFQSLWYRLLLLFFVPYLTVLWFVLGPANPGYAVNVAAVTFGLGPAIADPIARRVPPPMVPRAGGRAGGPSHPWRRDIR